MTTTTLILQIINAALQLLPVAAETITKIKADVAADPTVAAEFEAILAGTIAADDEAMALIEEWRSGQSQA
jgi:hypothetical protein